MTVINLLKPFEKTLENRRFKIILYFLTSIILAPVAAYLEHIGLRPVHIIWWIWLLIIPVTYGIYFVWANFQSAHTHLQQFVVHQLAKEKPYINAFKKAQAFFEQEKYEQALDTVDNIPKSFSDYDKVKKFQAACHFYLGIQFANQQDFQSALNHLQQAAELELTNEQIVKIHDQLMMIED